MTKADYIRQVDAMALPDGLYGKLAALPAENSTRATTSRPYKGQEARVHDVHPYRRWAAIAAALVLVVGLGAATPTILHALTPPGGDITNPPPVVTQVPAISDEELTELLVAATVDSAELNARSQWELLFSARQNGRTLGVARGISDMHAGGLSNLILGVFDDSTKAIVEEIFYVWQGDDGQLYTWADADGGMYLLPVNTTVTTGVEVCSAGLYWFRNGSFLHMDQLPLDIINQKGVPDEAVEMFHWKAAAAGFWDDHKAVINGAGLDLYSRTPGWEMPADGEQWAYLGRIPLPLSAAELDAAPILTDEQLTNLLVAELTLEKTPQDSWKLLGFSSSPEGRTLGILQYEWAGSDGTPDSTTNWSNLFLGVYDNATRELTGPVIRVNGQLTYALPYTTGSGGQDYYVLCIGRNHGQGIAENSNVALYYFDGMELRQVTTSPGAVLPEGMEDMFDPAKNGDFWKDNNHKIALAPGGFDLFERNPDWDTSRNREETSPWRYVGYVPLAYKFPDTWVIEQARRLCEERYIDSSNYSIQLCELVPGYKDPEYSNAHAYYIKLGDEWNTQWDPYLLFDDNGKLLGVRSTPEFSLTIDGKSYPLGVGTRGIFGTPSSTNMTPETDERSVYSEWFSPDSNSSGYSYYKASGNYCLTSINTTRENVYTYRGIHVGSTVAELKAAYPELIWSGDEEISGFNYSVTSTAELQFSFPPTGTEAEALIQKVTSITLTTGFGYWPET